METIRYRVCTDVVNSNMSLQDFSDSIVTNVSNEIGDSLVKFGTGRINKNGNWVDISSSDSIKELLGGTINLTSKIIDEAKNGDPIDFLVFMDKSARNGSFMLRVLWSELDKRGEIPNEIKLPEIRFVNIGRNDDRKHNSKAALTLLKLKYGNIFKDKKIAVIDDHILTGNSQRLAKITLKEVFFPKEVMCFEQFHNIFPHWEFGEKIKGVSEVINSHESNYYKKRLFEKWDKIGTSNVSSIYKKMLTISKEDFYKMLEGKNSLFKVRLNLLGVNANNADIFWLYIHTAGGFTALPLESNDQKNFVYYRGILKEIVVKAMEYRDKEK